MERQNVFYQSATHYGGSSAVAKRREAARRAFFTTREVPVVKAKQDTVNNLVQSYTISANDIVRQGPSKPQLTNSANRILNWIEENSLANHNPLQLTKRRKTNVLCRHAPVPIRASRIPKAQPAAPVEVDQFPVPAVPKIVPRLDMNLSGADTRPAKQPALVQQQPKPQQPKWEQPKWEQPKMEKPKMEQPKMEQPKMELPKMELPKMELPKLEPPKLEPPKLDPPKLEPPKLEQPKPEQPKPKEPTFQPPQPAKSEKFKSPVFIGPSKNMFPSNCATKTFAQPKDMAPQSPASIAPTPAPQSIFSCIEPSPKKVARSEPVPVVSLPTITQPPIVTPAPVFKFGTTATPKPLFSLAEPNPKPVATSEPTPTTNPAPIPLFSFAPTTQANPAPPVLSFGTTAPSSGAAVPTFTFGSTSTTKSIFSSPDPTPKPAASDPVLNPVQAPLSAFTTTQANSAPNTLTFGSSLPSFGATAPTFSFAPTPAPQPAFPFGTPAAQAPAPNLFAPPNPTNPFQPASSSIRGRKILKPVRRIRR